MLSLLRALPPLVALPAWAWALAGVAAAQPAASAPAGAPAPEPKVERLVHGDAFSRVEELRVGGRTRSIEVQTRSALPGYEVRPIDPAQDDRRSGAGQRQWRVLAF